MAFSATITMGLKQWRRYRSATSPTEPRLLLPLFFAKNIFNCRHHWCFEVLSVLTIMLQLAHIILQGLVSTSRIFCLAW